MDIWTSRAAQTKAKIVMQQTKNLQLFFTRVLKRTDRLIDRPKDI